ncbi:MAG TPA: CopY family transcriptional repressor [Microscillaceae bacterium]|nr:CopY family transcriptional repressor [Microscillaceae bacterium]
MEELTKNEEAIMHILWKIERGTVRDVMAHMPEPLPPYTTVSSIVRLLEKKGYVGHKAYGKTHEYFPEVPKSAYRKKAFNALLKNYFEGSAKKVVSFLVKEKNLDTEEAEEIKKMIDQFEQEQNSGGKSEE